MNTPTPADYWDIEGQLVAGVVRALKAIGIESTEMQAGEIKQSARVEVQANIVSATDSQGQDANENWVYTTYRMQVVLELYSPRKSHEQHRRWRGVIRGLLARVSPNWLRAQLAYGSISDYLPGDSTNSVQAEFSEFDDLLTAMSFSCTYEVLGRAPVQPVE